MAGAGALRVTTAVRRAVAIIMSARCGGMAAVTPEIATIRIMPGWIHDNRRHRTDDADLGIHHHGRSMHHRRIHHDRRPMHHDRRRRRIDNHHWRRWQQNMQQRANNKGLTPRGRTGLYPRRAENTDQNHCDDETVHFFHVDLPFKSADFLIRYLPR